MAIAAIFDYGTPPDDAALRERQYDRVSRELGGGERPGRLQRWPTACWRISSATQDGRGMIVNVFESQEAMDRLMTA